MIVHRFRRVVAVGLSGLIMLMGCAAIAASTAETPGERFQKAIKEIAAACASRKLAPNEVCGEVTKLKPADPLATPEGRFAHSIKIPNPVPEDSGYKPGMTPQEYFDYLCKTEAGEFIYKTVENVEGIYQMRPRDRIYDAHLHHLYAMEDLYGYTDTEATRPEGRYVGPNSYKYFEDSKPISNAAVARYHGYDGRDQKTMKKEFDTTRKSRYGYTWRGISRPHDRERGITGGELIVLDLLAKEVLAVRRGYIQGDIEPDMPIRGIVWRRPCPLMDTDARFIFKVLKPSGLQPSVQGGPNVTK